MATIANLNVGITASARGFTSAIGIAQKGIHGLGSAAAGIGRKLTSMWGLVAGGGAIYTLKRMTDLAQVQFDAERKLAAVIRATGGAAGYSTDQLKKLASQRQAVTNFGDEATLSMMAVLATFKEIKGDVFEEAVTAIQDISTVMGQDLQSSAVQIGKALNDPIKGLTALTRVGVSFTQSQKDQIKALQESGNLMGAQKVILAELKSEFGGAAEAMANPMTQLKNALGDVGEQIGMQVLPFVRLLAGDAKTAAESMNTSLASTSESFGLLGDAIIAVADGIQDMIDMFKMAKIYAADYAKVAIQAFDPTGAVMGMSGAARENARLTSDFIDELMGGTRDQLLDQLMKDLAKPGLGDILRERVRAERAKMADMANVPAFGKMPGTDGADLMGSMANAAKQATKMFSPAMLRGSKEAYSLEMRDKYGQKQNDLGKQQLDTQKKGNGLLEQIRDRIPDIAAPWDSGLVFTF